MYPQPNEGKEDHVLICVYKQLPRYDPNCCQMHRLSLCVSAECYRGQLFLYPYSSSLRRRGLPSCSGQLVAPGVNASIYVSRSKCSLTTCYLICCIPPGSSHVKHQLVPDPTVNKHALVLAILIDCGCLFCFRFPSLPTLGSYQCAEAIGFSIPSVLGRPS